MKHKIISHKELINDVLILANKLLSKEIPPYDKDFSQTIIDVMAQIKNHPELILQPTLVNIILNYSKEGRYRPYYVYIHGLKDLLDNTNTAISLKAWQILNHCIFNDRKNHLSFLNNNMFLLYGHLNTFRDNPPISTEIKHAIEMMSPTTYHLYR